MPRVSIIIPYLHDDARLEATLVSVLENRPSDCEILVVHDGSYTNPYQLEDEVVLVDTDAGATAVDLINAALRASCAPFLHTLWPGIEVFDHWLEEALEELEGSEAAAAALGLELEGGGEIIGVHGNPYACAAPWSSVLVSLDSTAPFGPLLHCAVYRRRVLLGLDGLPQTSVIGASLLTAAAIDALGFDTIACAPVGRTSSHVLACQSPADLTAISQAVVAIHQQQPTFAQAARWLLSGLCTRRWTGALAWLAGSRTAHALREDFERRIDGAAKNLQGAPTISIPLPSPHHGEVPARRAA
ncbi:MAG: hypothetical protein KatS3mg111_0432 [Pirellulaceae bacterium]|nr:MAG: hypothetical protein KatS3mg111_0432 [Pirellulaceae bacterium]